MANDWYGSTTFGNNNLHFYFVSKTDMESTEKNKMLIPPTDAVINAVYMPYLNLGTTDVETVTLDVSRFAIQDNVITNKNLKRVKSHSESSRLLRSFAPYRVSGTSIGGEFKWQNEGKLWNYPFQFLSIEDGTSTPLQIHNQFLSDKTRATLRVNQNINNFGMYALYIEGYKGDTTGMVEGAITSSINMGISSLAYTDYMARSQHQFKLNRVNSFVNSGITAISGMAMLGTGNVIGGTSAMANAITTPFSSFAQERDLQNSPANVHSTGGEGVFTMQEQQKLYIYRFAYDEVHLERIGWHFHKFGYTVNRFYKPSITSRKRFNFIKCSDVNIKTTNVPKRHTEVLQQIFNQGVTFWHVDNIGVSGIKDYTMDNEEV